MRLHKGFTLVELLVAAALFATVVVVAVNIFVLTLRKPLRQIDNQHVQEEINYVFELLSYRIGQATIDYAQYGGSITNPVSELFIDVKGDELEIFLDSGQIWIVNLVSGDKFPLSSTVDGDVEIDELTFYVYPTSDPTEPANGVNYQEAVVVYISGHGVQDPAATFAAQTFMTFRSYAR